MVGCVDFIVLLRRILVNKQIFDMNAQMKYYCEIIILDEIAKIK